MLGERYRWGEAPNIDPVEIFLEWNFAKTKNYVQQVGGDLTVFWTQTTRGTARTMPQPISYDEFLPEST